MVDASNQKRMNPAEYQFIKAILIEAQEIDEQQQQSYVERACINKPELIEQILKMLAIQDSDDNNVMENPPITAHIPEVNTTNTEKQELTSGTQVNQYTIIEKIGNGGMGIVYSAQQNYPAERIVALKLIKNIPNQEQLISESNILAKLNHANIASLIEINKTSEGQLYIAMEFIEGADIITWCENKNYGLKPIIGLFQQLCAGISYAHEKGIIHCDIKPSNVLVVDKNNIATIKIIDFGISQFENHHNDRDNISGTPAYLAPEVLNHKDTLVADTRRDVYALGVLLKKLLSKVFNDNLPNDLKVIIDKSTAVDKHTRYASPARLSDDLNHFLIKKPVSARQPNFIYLSQLFIRRHVFVVLASLALVTAITTGYLAQLRQAEIANTARLEAEKMSTFLTEIFNVANPEKSQTDSLKAIDLLNNAQNKLLAIKEPTLSDARFMHTVGSILTRLDHLKDAKKIIEKSLQIKQKYLKETDGEIIQGLIQLGLLDKNLDDFISAQKYLNKAINLLKKQKDTDLLQLSDAHNHLGNLFFKTKEFDKAIIQHQAAIAIRKRLDDKKLLADSYNNLGVVYREQNELIETAKYMHLALDLYVQEYGQNHPFIGIVKNNLSKVEENLYHYQKAEQLIIDSNTIFNKSYGASHYNTVTSLLNLILFYERRMRYAEAIELFEASIDKLDKTTNYNKKLSLMSWVAFIYAKNGQFDESNILHQQSINLVNQKQPTEKYLYERIYARYANSLVLQKHYESADKLLVTALVQNKKKYETNNYMFLYILRLKAEIALETQKFDVAKKLIEQIIGISSKQRLIIVEQIPALIDLAKIERNSKQIEKAHKALKTAMKLNNSIKSSNQKTTALIDYQQGLTYLAEDKNTQAKTAFEKALAIQILELPKNHPDLIATQNQLESMVGRTRLTNTKNK